MLKKHKVSWTHFKDVKRFITRYYNSLEATCKRDVCCQKVILSSISYKGFYITIDNFEKVVFIMDKKSVYIANAIKNMKSRSYNWHNLLY